MSVGRRARALIVPIEKEESKFHLAALSLSLALSTIVTRVARRSDGIE